MKKLIIAFLLTGCHSNLTPKSGSDDFCRLRALYKESTGGTLDAAPDSLRARLEAAEYAFCATLPQ